jgi:transposase
MAGAYSQDLRDRVIDAVIGGKMSRRAATALFGVSLSSVIKWVQRFERTGSRRAARMGGYKPVKIVPHREFLEAAREKPDITLKALCDRLLTGCGVKADTSMMRRFFRGIGVTLKKRRSSHASATARTSAVIGGAGAPLRSATTPRACWFSTRPQSRPI